jgi:hypothetical protein
MAVDRDGSIYLALREGNAIYRIAPDSRTLHHLAGTGEQGYSGDGGPAPLAKLAGPKGLALSGRNLYLADTENHAIRRIDLDRGTITTVLGTGVRGDGPETDPLQCKLSRPHGLFADASGKLYVTDSEGGGLQLTSSGSRSSQLRFALERRDDDNDGFSVRLREAPKAQPYKERRVVVSSPCRQCGRRPHPAEGGVTSKTSRLSGTVTYEGFYNVRNNAGTKTCHRNYAPRRCRPPGLFPNT